MCGNTLNIRRGLFVFPNISPPLGDGDVRHEAALLYEVVAYVRCPKVKQALVLREGQMIPSTVEVPKNPCPYPW
jgi:hypothetical protein